MDTYEYIMLIGNTLMIVNSNNKKMRVGWGKHVVINQVVCMRITGTIQSMSPETAAWGWLVTHSSEHERRR